MKNIIILLAIGFLGSLAANAQQDTAFVRTFGGPYYEEGRQIIECADGGYAVIGTTGSDQSNNTNFYLLRLDEELNCMWNRNYGGAEVEWGYSIVEDANGNFLLCGYTNSFGEGGYDILVYKVDPLGNIIWQHTYGGSDWDFAYKMIAHPDNGYLICGKTYSYGNGGSDAYLLHISDDGNLLNEWTYGGEGDDEFRDMLFFNSSLHCVKSTENQTSSILAINSEGIIIQDITIASSNIIVINSIAASNSNLYLCGIWIGENNFYNCYLSSIHSDYSIEWEEYGPDQYQYEFTKVAIAENELIYVGNTISFGYGGEEILFQRRHFDSYWTAGPSFGTEENDLAYDLIIDSQQRPIIVGTSNGYNNENTNELYLIRLQDADLTFTYEEIEELGLGCFTVDIEPYLKNQTPTVYYHNGTLFFQDTMINEYTVFNNIGQVIESGNQNQLEIGLNTGIYIIQFTVKTENTLHYYTKKITVF